MATILSILFRIAQIHSDCTFTVLALRRLLAVGIALGGACENLLGDQTGVLPDRGLDLGGDVGIGLEESFCVLAALAESLAVIGEPGAGFFHDPGLDAEIED